MLALPNPGGEYAVIFAFLLSMLAAVDEPAEVLPPPIITPRPAAPPAPPAPPAEVAAPRSTANLLSLFSVDDYPEEALQAGQQGTVAVRLLVTTDGRVGDCEVTSSSGSQVLDRATCDILQRRARFTPARDQRGRPTIDYYTQRVRWELPRDPKPFVNVTERLTIRFDGAGKVVGCRFDLDGQGGEMSECSQVERLATTILAGREEQARGMSLIIQRRFEANPTGDVPQQRLTKWDILIGRGVIDFDIDATGQSHDCKQLLWEGPLAERAMCATEGSHEFEPATAANIARRRGRFTFVSYLEPLLTAKPVIDPKANPR